MGCVMSEELDLVSDCCRAKTQGKRGEIIYCMACHLPCREERPDRSPPPHDPDRKSWKKKEPPNV